MPFYYYPISTIPTLTQRQVGETYVKRYEGNIYLFSINSYEIVCQTATLSYNSLNRFYYQNNTCYVLLDSLRTPQYSAFGSLRQPYYMSYHRLRGDSERIDQEDCVIASIVGNETAGNMPVPSNFYLATSAQAPTVSPLVFLRSRMLTSEQPLPHIENCTITNPSWLFEGLQHYTGSMPEATSGSSYRKYMILDEARRTLCRCAVPVNIYGETGYGKPARFWKAVVPARTSVPNSNHNNLCENAEGTLNTYSGLIKSLPKCRITTKTYSDRYVLATRLLSAVNTKLRLTGDKLVSWRQLPADLSKLTEEELAQLQNVKHSELLKTFPQGRTLLRL